MTEKTTYQEGASNKEHLDEMDLAVYAEYLRNETAVVPGRLIEHVESCSYCRAEIMAITDQLDVLPDVAEESVQSYESSPLKVVGGKRMKQYRWLRAVASVAAVFMLAWIVQQMLPDKLSNEPLASHSTSKPALTDEAINPDGIASDPQTAGQPLIKPLVTDTIQYALAFIPDPVCENLLKAKYRAGGDPKVMASDPSTIFAPGDFLKLSWTPEPEDEYVLIILNNKARKIKEIKLSEGSELVWKIDLNPGLYYWKFMGKEEMWKVGKFVVMQPAQ